MDKQRSEHRWRPFIWLAAALAALAALAAIVARWLRQRPAEKRLPALPPETPPGLSEEEAAARWTEGQDNTVHLKPPRTQKQIWRENIYNIFNLSLVGLALTQLLLQQWLSALLSLGTIALNVGLNVGQEVLAMRRLADFQRWARPRATVVREGKTRSIDPNQVVPGDVLIVGPGDQFLVDGQVVGSGQMVVDASVITGQRGWQTVRAGDPVYAGAYCISGRGAYVAQKVGRQRLIVSRIAQMPVLAEELTPLERLIDRILRILLVLVATFAVLLLAAFFRLDPGIPVDLFNDMASVIFNVAPSGLFLMIVVTYTTGTADLARLGALVHRARSVESLAEATVICFAEAGLLAGTLMEMEQVQHPDDPDYLPESRLRQILGDYARSTAAPNLVTRILINSFEGNRRAVREEAPFLAAYGWSAVTFDEQDLQGVYVLGEPQMLADHLITSSGQPEEGASRSPAGAVRRLMSPLGRLLKRGDKGAPPNEAEEPPPDEKEQETAEQPDIGGEEEAPPAEDDETAAEERQPFFRRWAKRVGQRFRRARHEPEQPAETTTQQAVLLLAYHPESAPLHDAQGSIRLPQDLIPLCELRYSRRLSPEAFDLVRAFAQRGVSVKVFASGEPEEVLALFQQAGLGEEAVEHIQSAGAISGHELEQLPPQEWERAAAEHSVFGHLTPAQAGRMVRALRSSGESVAVLGDGIADLPALQQANLAIARQTSTQAALGVADIVMMDNSPQTLLRVLHKGQRIVHGLLDILKLNLVQVVYLALLIGAIRMARAGFPYASAQGTAIAVITVTLPSLGLTFWAQAGVVASERFGQILARFVGPAAVGMSLAAFLVYLYFLDQTGQMTYAQLAVTYTLIYSGLLLAVFAKPPWSFRERKGVRKREWRMTALALVLGVATFFLPAIPAAQKYLKLDWLRQPADYGAVGLAVLGWALLLGVVWWLIPPADAQDRQPSARRGTRREGEAAKTEQNEPAG